MTKFEGIILLALVAGWLLASPAARPVFRWSPRIMPLAAFWLLAALPFLWLRMHIPVLHWESDWLHYGLNAPGRVAAATPTLFAILTAQSFFSEVFAHWTSDDRFLRYNGHWEGWSSLYNHSNGGLAWFCLAMTVIVWIACPGRRAAILWPLVIFTGMMAALSVVLACLAVTEGLNGVIEGLANDFATGRYLLPMQIAWAAGIVTVCFGHFADRSATRVPDADQPQ